MTSPDPTPSLPAGYDGLAEARRLLTTLGTAALGTLTPDTGHPFTSLVTVAMAADGAPILLLSQLSAHTQHLQADPRLSLLLADIGKGDPLAHPRLSLIGTATRVDDPAARDDLRTRFLARHPKAALYIDFPDFAFWRVSVLRAHLNGGFAKAATFAGADLTAQQG